MLKAHVEASTEFSIFLSGFLVKFGILGIYSVIAINNNVMISNLFSSLALIGIVDSLIKIVGQVDLKRVVALTTVIEANWMLLCLISPSRFLVEVGYLLIFIHCMTTTIEFYIVEFIYRRYGTRNLNKVSGLYTLYPNLSKVLLLSLLIVIGLPGTTIFTLKLIFFTNLVQYSFTYFMVLLFSFMLAMPIIFIKIFMLLRGGLICNSTNIRFTRDLTSVELLAILPPIVFSLVGGLLIFIIL